jgi:hypothetical protein
VEEAEKARLEDPKRAEQKAGPTHDTRQSLCHIQK